VRSWARPCGFLAIQYPREYPRAIEFIDKLPRTQTGKLQCFKLHEPR